MFGTILFLHAALTEVPHQVDDMRVVRKAYSAATESLHSGIGSGVYRQFVIQAGKPVVASDATFKVYFDKPKYRIELKYKQDYLGNAAKVIVFDGTSLASKYDRPAMRPLPVEAEVIATDVSPQSLLQLGFGFDPCKLPRYMFRLDIDVPSKTPSTVERKADGAILGKVDLGFGVCSFVASPSCGYNVSESDIRDGAFLGQQCTAKWQRNAGVWVVSELDKKLLYRDGNGVQWHLRFDSFEPNVKVSPELFTFASLGLPPGAGIIDRKPGGPDTRYVIPE
jgi:hypothetical protein